MRPNYGVACLRQAKRGRQALPPRIQGFASVARLVFGHNDSASPAERLFQRTVISVTPKPDRVRLAVFFACLLLLRIQTAWAASPDRSFTEVARRVRPVVVSISVKSAYGREISRTGLRQGPSALRYGSGFVLDATGHILTSNHVIERAIGIQVGFSDGKEYAAEIVGQDPDTDLALIRLISAAPIDSSRIARLGASDSTQVGDWVMAVGSPFGYHHTVSVGVISAKGRHLERIQGDIPAPPFQDFLQTDASINPGNSGGPLVNSAGRVVGVNTAYNPAGSGIGFAIPIDVAGSVAAQLREHGEVVRGYLGIHPQDLTSDLADALELDSTAGILIGEVQVESPAGRGGLKRGDIIRTLDVGPIHNAQDFLNRITGYRPGESVSLFILRDGVPLTISCTLDRRPKQPRPPDRFRADSTDWPGLEVKSRSDWQSGRLQASRTGPGVVVHYVAPGSPAENKLIERGDAILEIDGVSISNVRDYRRMVEEIKRAVRPGVFLILKKHDGSTRFVALRPRR